MTRTAPFIGSPMYGGHLRDSESESSQVSSARIPRTIGGNNRLYYELLTGQTLSGQSPCSPRNPRGIIGHDHSGASWGRPIKHTIWTLAPADPDLSTVSGADNPPHVISSGSPTGYKTWKATHNVFVPACAPGGAYEELTLDVVMWVITAATGTPVCSLIVRIDDTETTLSFDISSTGAVTDSDTIKTKPGTWNRIYFELSAYDSTAFHVSLAAISLSQTATT